MLGLVPLERILHPSTTVEKFLFLVENMFTNGNPTTAIVSFVALGTLLVLRFLKGIFKKYWFIYRIPEVLVVVVVSTSEFDRVMPSSFINSLYYSFICRIPMGRKRCRHPRKCKGRYLWQFPPIPYPTV